MARVYQVAGKKESKKIVEFLVKNGQMLLPMVEFLEDGRLVIDEVIDVMGRAAVEAVLRLSAQSVAGPPQQGKKRGSDIYYYGRQAGSVMLSDRKLRVSRQRLRKKHNGKSCEVAVPVYGRLRENGALGERVLATLLRGISTRDYGKVIREMADTAGVSKSSVSREFVAASAAELEALCARRFDDADFLVIYIDGVRFGQTLAIAAVGLDLAGRKHVLGLVEGATENETVAKGLLEDLVARGIKPTRKRLFVIDGSKALRSAIDAVYGSKNHVQRCRNHKIRNVQGYLPQEMRARVAHAMKAAYRLDEKDGMKKLEKFAQWLELEYPSAAGSLREGMAETFTINRLRITGWLARCLASTNIIENAFWGVRRGTRNVTRWRNADMALRWAASCLLHREKRYKRIQGYEDLWMLDAMLQDEKSVLSKKNIDKALVSA
jgi:transposase-like protein